MDNDDEEDDWSWPLVCVLPSVLENEMAWEHPSPISHHAPFIRSMGWPQNHWVELVSKTRETNRVSRYLHRCSEDKRSCSSNLA